MVNTTLTEIINKTYDKKIVNPIIDGFHITKMMNHLKEKNGEDVANSTYKNAINGLNFYANPLYESNDISNNLSKILCLGKVQSGKTGFFISSISLAFDNGYGIAYLIGGTKNTLKEQNFKRISSEFANNSKVLVLEINNINISDIRTKLQQGYKIVLVCLKNSSEKVNLGKAISIANEFSNIPSIVVDDEGDEFTPGAPNLKKKNNKISANHDKIVSLLQIFKNVTYLSVTATPQSNFLLSTIDEISPDYAILIEPGESYTGGNAFHDVVDNSHVIQIDDSDDFKTCIPTSFKESLYYFVFCACLTRARNNYMPLSMLVHPSAITRIQNEILYKIKKLLETSIEDILNPNSINKKQIVYNILQQKYEYMKTNFLQELDVTDEQIINEIKNVAENLSTFVFNVSKIGKEHLEQEKNDKNLYKIFIGGNMLGRGLTINNLIVTYMYRDSKIAAIDTLYQRARWFGYKAKYFDLCRVYMTRSLIEKFVSIVDNENDMWEALYKFLESKIDIKEFPRIFTISGNHNLILTRQTVSKTIVIDRINEGFQYDKSMSFTSNEKENNKSLYIKYLNKYKDEAKEISYTPYQKHLVINTKFTKFYSEFLSEYKYPKGSKFSITGFQKILNQIENNEIDDEISVIIMRYKTGEYRSVKKSGTISFIGELLQSYDNNTGYKGDKNLPEFKSVAHFQIHLVYGSKNDPDDYVPLLAHNNPISQKSIKLVTGENFI